MQHLNFTHCDVNAVCNVTGTNLAGATVTATTLECLRCLYGTINYTPRVPEKNMIGVTNYLNEVYLPNVPKINQNM